MADGTRVLDPEQTSTIEAGDTIATDAVTDGGVADSQKVQRIKTGFGTDGEYADVTSDDPLPVDSINLGKDGAAILSALAVLNDTMERVQQQLGQINNNNDLKPGERFE